MNKVAGWMGATAQNDLLQRYATGLTQSPGIVYSATDANSLDDTFTYMSGDSALLSYQSNELSENGKPPFFAKNNVYIAISGYPQLQGGYTGSDSSKTLSIIHDLYLKHRQDVINHIHGRFALAILDTNSRTVILATDRLGIEPMCFAETAKQGIVFGSNASAVNAHPEVQSEILPQSIYDYLFFHVVPSPISIYRSIRKLEPAQQLIYHNGQIDVRRYWYPQMKYSSASFTALKQQLKSHLQQSVQRCHITERTGSFLSGGLDSSTVTGFLSNLQADAQAFTIGFEEQGYDETPYAKIAAQHFGVNLNVYYVTAQDILQAIPDIARTYDEPYGNSSAIPALICAQQAKQHGMNVLLAGDGGDELFAGNSRYAKQKIFELYSRYIPQSLRSGLLEPLMLGFDITDKIPVIKKLRSYIAQAKIEMPSRTESYNFIKRSNLDELYDAEFLANVDQLHPDQLLKATYEQTPSDKLVERMLYLDWKFTLADNDLRKVNTMCELAGIDVQYPMLDDELVRFSCTVPDTLKLKGSQLRYFYKQALLDFLPRQIIDKPKHGFGLPFGEWLKKSPPLQDLIYDNISDLKQRRICRTDFLDHLVDTHKTGHAAYYGTMVWVLAMLEEFFKQHNLRTQF